MLSQNKTIRLIILLLLSIILTSVSTFFASSSQITSISVDAERPTEQIKINLKIKGHVAEYNFGLYRLRKKQFVFYMDVKNCYMLEGGATFKRKVKNSPLSNIRIGQKRLNPPIIGIACDLTQPILPYIKIKLKDGYIQILFRFNSFTPSKTPPKEDNHNVITKQAES